MPRRLLICMALACVARTQAAECCSSCIGQPSPSPYDYDPLRFDQCSLHPNGARVCCFDCGADSDPIYGEMVSFATADGVTPTVRAGTWVKLQWAQVAMVTYVVLADGQHKTQTPTVNGTAATQTAGLFFICAGRKGSIVLRGWGNDTCRHVSTEKTIEVLDGNGTETCDQNSPDAPTSTAYITKDGPCNLLRASIKTINGEKKCVCVSDWSDPPSCGTMPLWKWLITIGGGIAALFSIGMSVRAIIKSRNEDRQERAQHEDLDVLCSSDSHSSTPPLAFARASDANSRRVDQWQDQQFSDPEDAAADFAPTQERRTFTHSIASSNSRFMSAHSNTREVSL